MPIPLIAAALIAAGAASGGSGVALGGKGAYDIRKAQKQLKKSSAQYEKRRAKSELRLEKVNERLQAYGRQQEEAIQLCVLRMGEFLRRNARQVQESERLLVDGVDATFSQVSGLRGLEIDAVRWVSGVVTSGLTGAGVGAGLTSAVGTFGVASTGTAISGLSGAAASNATLAALGGGSLATNGGGMALGATALNFVTIGPALLVGGMVIKGQGTRALTQARKLETKVAVGIAELDRSDEVLKGVDNRCEELASLLSSLTRRAVIALDLLESEPFVPEVHAPRFQNAIGLVMAVRDVAATPLLEADSTINGKTDTFSVRYSAMTDGEPR
jgi:hypothetical protein